MFFKYSLPALLWAFFIGVLCAIPGQDLPKSDWFELLKFDKFVHASLFGVLVFLMARGFRKQTSSSLFFKHAGILALLIAIPYGGILELMQGAFFENRSADIYDFIANSIGSFIGLWWVSRKSK
jgi:VanZ family protein